jgi:hypothetical protein
MSYYVIHCNVIYSHDSSYSYKMLFIFPVEMNNAEDTGSLLSYLEHFVYWSCNKQCEGR